MEYEIIERDFVIRSLLILQQYEQHVKPFTPTDKHFEVTLLLNCLLGLIILPFEHLAREQNNNKLPEICEEDETPINKLDSEWGLDNLRIEKIKINGREYAEAETTLRIIVAMFRHSMAHGRFKDGGKHSKPNGLSVVYKGKEHDPLESVIYKVNLKNIHKESGTEFIASISVESLRKFAMKLAYTFLNEHFNIN